LRATSTSISRRCIFNYFFFIQFLCTMIWCLVFVLRLLDVITYILSLYYSLQY
jgi:hypothetical protein